MDEALSLLEKSIQKAPGVWLWQHNRWKQQTPHKITKRFRHDCLCVVMPPDRTAFEHIAKHLPTLKEIYPTEFISLFIPESLRGIAIPLETAEKLYYKELKGTLLNDYRFKLVLNFTSFEKIRSHYRKLSAFEVLNLAELTDLAAPHLLPDEKENLSAILKRALYRPKNRSNAS